MNFPTKLTKHGVITTFMFLISFTIVAQPAQILHEGCICFDSAAVDQSLNWYALTKSDKPFYYTLKAVKLELQTRHDCELQSLKIKTNHPVPSQYLIGTKGKLKERTIYAPHGWNGRGAVDVTKTAMSVYSIDLEHNERSTTNNLYLFGDNVSGGFGIIGINNKGEEVAQELVGYFNSDIIKRNGLYLTWFGDLDGDNKADLILFTQTNGEGGSFYFLLLTSLAKDRNLIEKAGETNIGYCN